MFSPFSVCLRVFSSFISSWLKQWRNGLLHLLSLSLCCQPFQLLAATGRATDTRTKAAAANVLPPVPLQQSTLTLSPTSATHAAGTGRCIVATYTNATGQAVRGASVGFTVTGANAMTGTVSTDWAGQATFCYTGTNAGSDTITASVGSVSATATKTWRSSALIASEAVIVRHGFTINSGSRVEGTVRQLLGEATILNSGAVITQDLLVPGIPTLIQNGTSTFGGTITGTGSATPTNYQVTLNTGITLGKLRNRIDPLTIANVAAPPAPTGTRSVTITATGQSIGTASTLRDLTLNSNVGQYAVPPGTYGNFIANNGSGFTFGVAGATQPVTYNLTNFTLNSNSQLQIVSPVILVLANGTTLNAAAGSSGNPSWLTVKVATGAVTLNSGSFLYGALVAPSSTVTLNATSQLIGNVTCDRLTLNGNCLLRGLGNQAPVLSVGTSGNQTITLPTNSVNLNATVTDDGLPGGAVSVTWSKVSGPGNVSFSAANANTTTATFTAAGTYVLRVTANDGAASSSDDVIVTVIPANQAPVVNAGADQAITLPTNIVALVGAATDDGFPVGNTLATTWAKVGGPGTVTFANTTATSTSATFSSAGSYTLRLTASDGLLSASDDVIVTVNAANQPPVVSAGVDQTITPGTNLLQNPGNEFALVGGQITNWNVVSGNWTQATAGTNNFPAALTGNTYFAPDDNASAELRQDVNVAAFAATIASGTQLFAFNGWALSGQETPADNPQIIVEYRDATNTNVLATYDSGPQNTTNNWKLLADTRPAPAGTGWIRVRLLSTRNRGTGNNGYFDQLSLRAVAGVGVTLNGTVSDDGLPAGSTVTTTWSKASGADPVTFANASAAQTAVSLTNAGTYVLRLTASDSALSANSNVTITVNPGNAAPTVNAGTNQTIELPNTASLSGSVADDGKPLGSTVTTRWSVTSGTGTVTFANPNTAATTASFSAPGTYVLRLAADDTDAVTTSEITITVKPQNLAPVVNAGPDVAVALPGSATLNGTATDDGQPNNTLTVAWSKVSGPGTVTFSAPNAAMTNAAFSVAGSYTLRLTATDGVLTTSDDVIVTVSPANQAPIVNAGADQLITFPANTTLAGTATDDGYPTGSSVSVTWSKVSGPGTVTFINVASLTTTASFSVSGVYTLRLMASDGALSSADDVVITVNQPPTVSAGAPQTITQNGNLIQNPSGDGSGGGGLGGWSEFGGGGWGAISGGFGGALGGFYFQAGNTATAELRQDTDVSGYATTIDATLQEFDLSGFVRSGAETPADSTRIIWEFRDAANANVLGSFDSGVITATTNWQAVTGKRLAPVGTRYIRIRLIGVRNSGTTNDAYFDGLAVRPTANAGVVLNGTATDDGLGGTLASTWSQVSGPGAVTFTNPNNATTGATFSAPGTYVLKLTATDTNATTTSTVTVTIAAPNQAPVVSAGANQTIALPVTAALSGSVTDDGLPLGSTIENKWSVVSGPGNVTFTSLGSPVTTASFSAPGTYVLRLSANDTDRLTSADVTITVLPPNQAPIVNAGADQLLAFPTAANLNGIATDDGYPVGSSLALTWSKVSGPGTVTFSAPNALATSASFSSSGSYVLRLTATDGALTTSDDVVITVNQAPVVSAGTEQTISLGQTVTLTGTATDDGIPVGSAVSVVWSKVSGPGDVTFAAPTSLTTTATFSAGGIYILRLTASDSQLTSADDVRINVRVRKLPPEYWLTFPGALVVNGNPIQPALYISAPRPTTGRVEIAGLNFSQDFTVTGNGSVKISLPVAADLNTASDQILNRGIHITAQDQITVTAVNYAHFETDSYFALPISELGSQYLVLSYPTGSGYGTQFALAATVNNTSVTITPSAPVGARAAGVPYTITLNQGDVYQLTTSQLVDLSGTAISANKKIAVFGSNRCTQVPAGDPACNYLVEQLPSLEYFGTSFLAYPLVRRVGGDTYRFIASQNNTHVTVNEQLLATLN